MKTLSIIAVIFSVFASIMSIAGIDNGCFNHDGSEHPEIFPTYLVINLFFLAFSITALVGAFKKPKSVNQ
jgi:hypothetical protein